MTVDSASSFGSEWTSKPLEAHWFGVSESDCEGRTETGKVRRGGSVGDGAVLANREDPEGRIQPQECRRGKPRHEWIAEQTVEVVETARAEHSG